MILSPKLWVNDFRISQSTFCIRRLIQWLNKYEKVFVDGNQIRKVVLKQIFSILSLTRNFLAHFLAIFKRKSVRLTYMIIGVICNRAFIQFFDKWITALVIRDCCLRVAGLFLSCAVAFGRQDANFDCIIWNIFCVYWKLEKTARLHNFWIN